MNTDYSTTSLNACSVSGNSAVQGGGLSTYNHGATELTDITVSGNTSVTGGGLSSDDFGSTALTNCTISGNSASRERRRSLHDDERHSHVDQRHRQWQLRRLLGRWPLEWRRHGDPG